MINLTNYRDHPSERGYVVFFYTDFQMANYFEELLVEEDIPYERAVDQETGAKRYLFGVHKKHQQKLLKLNDLAIGKFRKPFIGSAVLRWIILGITAAMLLLGILGYIFNGTS